VAEDYHSTRARRDGMEGQMDHKIAGLLGAVGALASMGNAEANGPAPTDILKVSSYAELLNPIPNASEKLEAIDRAAAKSNDEKVHLAQFFIEREHHHHHHHNNYYRRYRNEPRVVVVPRGYRHHHHHHHNSYYRRYRDEY
jgi:hypothetical protein